MTLPHTLNIYQNGNYDDDSMRLFIKNILTHYKNIPGINGEITITEIFKQKWIEETKCGAELNMRLRCFKLEKVNEYNVPEGIFRKAIMDDADIIKKYAMEFSKEINEPLNGGDKFNRNMGESIDGGLYYVWENKEIVSMAKKVCDNINYRFI
jgi:predicted GNAT family acetyltransferase